MSVKKKILFEGIGSLRQELQHLFYCYDLNINISTVEKYAKELQQWYNEGKSPFTFMYKIIDERLSMSKQKPPVDPIELKRMLSIKSYMRRRGLNMEQATELYNENQAKLNIPKIKPKKKLKAKPIIIDPNLDKVFEKCLFPEKVEQVTTFFKKQSEIIIDPSLCRYSGLTTQKDIAAIGEKLSKAKFPKELMPKKKYPRNYENENINRLAKERGITKEQATILYHHKKIEVEINKEKPNKIKVKSNDGPWTEYKTLKDACVWYSKKFKLKESGAKTAIIRAMKQNKTINGFIFKST